MAKFTVPLNTAGHPTLQIATALSGRKLSIKEGDEITHPLRAVSVKSREFSVALSKFEGALCNLEQDKTLPHDNYLVDMLTELVYRATELMDVFAIDLGRAINLQPKGSNKNTLKDYNSAIKSARRDWGLICNKLKHNHNVIAPVTQTYLKNGIKVRGFVLLKSVGATKLDINKDFHQKAERYRSYHTALPQMIYSVLRCDALASELITNLKDDGGEELPKLDLHLNIGNYLRSIQTRFHNVGDTEPSKFDGFDVKETEIEMRRVQGRKYMGQIEMEVQYTTDGVTRSYTLP